MCSALKPRSGMHSTRPSKLEPGGVLMKPHHLPKRSLKRNHQDQASTGQRTLKANPPTRHRRTLTGTLCWTIALSAVRAEDWPQWQGPERNGISKETGLLQEWLKDGPPLA